VEVNEELDGSPELLNEAPYGEGWIFKIKATDVSDLAKLLSSEDYQNQTAD